MPESSQPDQTQSFPPTRQTPQEDSAASFNTKGRQPAERESTMEALGLPLESRVHLREPEGTSTAAAADSIRSIETAEDRNLSPSARLQVYGELARGGMGAILKGRDMDLGREVAVKVLLEAHKSKPEMVERFVDEARIHGQLQHPGLAPVYELGRLTDNRPYFSMKLVKGQTLSQLLAGREKGGPESPMSPRLLGIFEQICQTLAYAHARNVIHRDLKPSNVMVGAYGELQVMDWGLAKVLLEGAVADAKKSRARPQAEVSVIYTLRSETSAKASVIDSHTLAGTVLGTPAYMAPEQAQGDVESVDQRADVFGLGAILCEILTGWPPYTGTSAEVQRKARMANLEDTFTRLDACRADGQLIGLAKRCLGAEPGDRPADAGIVAKEITDYQHAVTERLRRAELERAAAEARTIEESRTRQMAEGRAVEERKRRHATLAFAAAMLALVVVGGSGAAWWWQEKTAAERDVEAALAEAATHRKAGRWPEARAALEHAAGRLGTWGLKDLREQVGQARLDSELVATLDEIRLAQSAMGTGKALDAEGTNSRYTNAFLSYGIDIEKQTPAEAAATLNRSAVRDPLLTGLYDWLRLKPTTDRDKLSTILNFTDDDTWRRSFRDAVLAKDIPKLKELASQKESFSQPPGLGFWLASDLRSAGAVNESEALLRRFQQQHPADFWLNYELGMILAFGSRNVISAVERPEVEAVGYFRAAVAIRPVSAIAHNYLGAALGRNRDLDGAIAEFHQAIRLDPKYAVPHTNLGLALEYKNDREGAIAEYRQAIELDQSYALAHNNLAVILATSPDPKFRNPIEAVAEAKEAVALDRKSLLFWNTLGEACYTAGLWKDAILALNESVALKQGGDAEDFFFLAMAHWQLGDKPEAAIWYKKGVAWMEKNQSKNPELQRFQTEARKLLEKK